MKKLLLALGLYLCTVSAGEVVITECNDISLINKAYANNKGIHAYQNASKDTLVINSWRC